MDGNLPLESVKWPRLPERGHFRSSALPGSEALASVMRVFRIISPVGYSWCPCSLWSATTARPACLPGAMVTVMLALSPSSLHVWREPSAPCPVPQARTDWTSHCCQRRAPGLCRCTTLGSPVPLWSQPHYTAPPLYSLSSAVCFMREITRRPVCQQLPCKSYLQKAGGGRWRGGRKKQ